VNAYLPAQHTLLSANGKNLTRLCRVYNYYRADIKAWHFKWQFIFAWFVLYFNTFAAARILCTKLCFTALITFDVKHSFLLCPTTRVEGIKPWCASNVCPSDVCLSVAYIGPKSRTESPRKTKIGTEVGQVTRDSDTTFKVKRSTCRGRGNIVAASRSACFKFSFYCNFYTVYTHFRWSLSVRVVVHAWVCLVYLL